jgi:hypothetical protein
VPTAEGLRAIESHPALLRYQQEGFDRVKGWCDPRTLSMLAELASFQDDAGVRGGSAEIGVYHGKLLIALHLLRSPGTSTLGIDLFENQDLNLDRSGAGDSTHVRANLRENCDDSDEVELMPRDSLDLGEEDVREIVRRFGRFRLFSVDGGHTVDHVVNDMRLAERLTAAGGIIVVDDYYNQDWPGVHEGIARRFILDSPRFVPFLVAFAKVYFTTLSHHERYLLALGLRLRMTGNRAKPIRMFGHEVLSVRSIGETPEIR